MSDDRRQEVSVGNSRVLYDRNPDICPLCHISVEPILQLGSLRRVGREAELEVVFKCPHAQCQSLFIASYRLAQDRISGRFLDYQVLIATGPVYARSPEELQIPLTVREVSKSFATIYAQAVAAEGFRLEQVAGAGYRKSLEFLVKDYCISCEPDAKEAIIKKWLGACINDHIADESIKQCARRATWLGNDETHYERKWADKDIEDLKDLIGLVMSWIDTKLRTAKYLEEMPGGEG